MSETDFQTIDPEEKKDFSFDWDDWIGSDSISTSVWAIKPAGPTLSGSAISTDVTSAFVNGATWGAEYVLTNTIVTAAGRTAERSFIIRCTHR